MKLKLITAPTEEPISLLEAKQHLRLDSGSFADNVESIQSIAPGLKAKADNYTTHVGAAVEVLNYHAVVNLVSGENGPTGTVDVKIQESNDGSTWADWPGGAFAQITTDGVGITEPDNATYEKAYTGTKKYIRTVAKVLLATCEFGTNVLRYGITSTEDALLTRLITAVRQQAEAETWRRFITQTWDLYLDEWPNSPTSSIKIPGRGCREATEDYIEIPGPPLQTGAKLYYTAYGEAEVECTDVSEDIIAEPGRLVLKTGYSWPSVILADVNPIRIRFTAGYGAAATVPEGIKTALLMMLSDVYENRGSVVIGLSIAYITRAIDNLLAPYRMNRIL
jgi:hypothetical protein